MPSSQAGLVRFGDEKGKGLSIKPGYVIVFAIIVIIIEVILHTAL